MSVRVSKCIIDTGESVVPLSQLITIVYGMLDVSDFINDRVENVFYKRL